MGRKAIDTARTEKVLKRKLEAEAREKKIKANADKVAAKPVKLLDAKGKVKRII